MRHETSPFGGPAFLDENLVDQIELRGVGLLDEEGIHSLSFLEKEGI